MLKLEHFILLIFIVLSSCKKQVQVKKETTIKKSKMSIAKTHKKSVEISDLAQKEIESWKEYKDVNSFLSRFHNISPNEALGMAIELEGLTKTMRDSLKIKELKVNALKARVNVFENEVLRLVDMTLISAIKDHEVNKQIDKVLLVFSGLNEKINTIYSKKKFDEEIDLNNFFELDTNTEKKRNDNFQKNVKDVKLKEKVE